MNSIGLLLSSLAVASAVYNETLAIEYANLAGAVYCDTETLETWDCGVKCIKPMTEIQVCQGSTTKAFVGKWQGKCVASFEGTNGLSSVGTDLSSFKTHLDCKDCWVHRGFLSEWRSLENCMTTSLMKIGCGPRQPLHGTGHSLGGAVVSLGMFDLKFRGWNVAEVYTFGMPRIGNIHFAHAFEKLFAGHFFRVTHGKDPFIDMPLGPFYVHVEPEVFYKGTVKEGYIICTNFSDTRCSAQYFPDFQNVASKTSVAYHHDYMGVDTTQAGCKNPQVSCNDDIPNSWCAYGIPCNKDVRGDESFCNHGGMMKLGYGKCHCHKGFCPNTYGKCVTKSEVNASLSLARKADSEAPSPMWMLVSVLVALAIFLAAFLARARKLGCHHDTLNSGYHLFA